MITTLWKEIFPVTIFEQVIWLFNRSSRNFQNINERAGYRKYLERDVWGFDMVIEQDYAKLYGEKDFFWQDLVWIELERSIAITRR